ncbi:MAG: transposase [Acidobacteria bacterium]|nr:transposase [Acidobacteriota bacterium]
MMGRQSADEQLFYNFRLEDHVPDDHLLRQLDAVLNFDRVRSLLANRYSSTGRPSIDPELMLRMLLIGYAYGIRSERRLCSEVHLNLAYRWFCRLGLQGAVPDHSTFSKNRYGRFRESDVYRVLFEDVVGQCKKAGLLGGEGFAVDSSLIGGDAKRDRRVESLNAIRENESPARPVREYLEALDAGNPVHQGDARYLSPTDPAAAWNTKEGRGKFGYFNNYLVDTDHAVIVDVEATPARLAQEISASKTMLERVEQTHGLRPEQLAADKAYGTGSFLGWLSERKITPHIPVLDRQHQTEGLLPRESFTFDPVKNHYICPQGKILKHRTAREENRIHIYRATASDCKECPIRPECTRGAKRTLSVPFDESARQKAMALLNTEAFRYSRRLRRKVEMLFAHMKQHLRFCRLKLRGLAGATEEFLLVATVQNLLRLVRLRPPDIPKASCPAAARRETMNAC